MDHKQITDTGLVNLFNKYYEKCINISKNTQDKLLIFLEFYKYYILVMNRFEQKILRMQHNTSKPSIESREIIRKSITKRKKEVDKILSELDDRNMILLVLAKKNTNTNKLPKNLANNIQLEYNAESLQKEFENNKEKNNFVKNVGINKLGQLYEKKFKNMTQNMTQNMTPNMTPNEKELLQKVNNILNDKAKKLSNIQALKLKKSLVNLNNTEKNKLRKLELELLASNVSGLKLQPNNSKK